MAKDSKIIKDNLLAQPSWILNDIKTLQWVRLHQKDAIDKNNLGGGNLLSLLGLFSVINYLAKVYKMLKSGKTPAQGKNSDPKHTFTEEDAFKRLIMDYPKKIVQPKQDNGSLTLTWRVFRDALAHVAQIPEGNRALVLIQDQHNIPADVIRTFLKRSKEKSFTLIGKNGLLCFVDKLASDVEEIRDWIINDIDSKFTSANIKLTLQWIDDNRRQQ